MYLKRDAGVSSAATTTVVLDEPQDLSMSKRSFDLNGNKTTDHSIATIMKHAQEDALAEGEDDCVGRKKQRVENIVHSIFPRSSFRRAGHHTVQDGSGEWRKRKNRKQIQPQQHGGLGDEDQRLPDEPCNDEDEKEILRDQLRAVNEQLRLMQQRFQELYERRERDCIDAMPHVSQRQQLLTSSFNFEQFFLLLREEIGTVVSQAVEASIEKLTVPAPSPSPTFASSSQEDEHVLQSPMDLKTSIRHASCERTHPVPFTMQAEQAGEEPLAYTVQCQAPRDKKKRTKVTDTRLSPRAARVLMAEVKPIEADPRYSDHMLSSLPTIIAAENPTLVKHNRCASSTTYPHNEENSSTPTQSDPESSDMDGMVETGIRASQTLTPLHLRKAKLMFLYVRYPSSALLKAYFSDVRFNKSNTAQLVKWFSNFREFYYIQMEKYARQALTDGLTLDDVSISLESELYKVLNLHYNRNNQIEVPRSYRSVIEATLKEFVKAMLLSKDQEQSWKKPIYKVIMRMDDVVPEFFKSHKWMERLTE